jgi:hypothetical protein
VIDLIDDSRIDANEYVTEQKRHMIAAENNRQH